MTDRALLQLILTAVHHRRRLAPLLTAFASDVGGVRRRRLIALSKSLEKGHLLSEGLEVVPHVMSEQAVFAVRMGTECGILPQVLRYLCHDMPESLRTTLRSFPETQIYLSVMCLAILAIATFLFTKIFPNFDQILSDMGSGRSSLLYDGVKIVLRWLSKYWLVMFGLLLSLFWLTTGSRIGRQFRWAILSRLIPWLQSMRSAEVIQYLSLAAEAGRPLLAAVSAMARYHYDPAIRQKLLYVRNEMELGVELWQCMQHVGFVSSSETRLLHAAETVGNQLWVAGRIAAAKRERAILALRRLQSLLRPLSVFIVSGIVLLLAAAVMSSLVNFTFIGEG